MKVKSISLVTPCYNEEQTLNAFYRQVVAIADALSDRRFEFIFVNDGSHDLSLSLLEARQSTAPGSESGASNCIDGRVGSRRRRYDRYH